jgi:hypothetical protein
MKDIFDLEIVPVEPYKMSHIEFFNKTKELLQKIDSNYGQAWTNRPLKDIEFPDESICEKCIGCGTFKKENGEEGDCVVDRERGQCYHRFMDAEQFGAEVETHLDQIWELLSVDEVTIK